MWVSIFLCPEIMSKWQVGLASGLNTKIGLASGLNIPTHTRGDTGGGSVDPTSNDSLVFGFRFKKISTSSWPDLRTIWPAGHGLASGLNIPNILPKNQVLRAVQKRHFFLRGW